MRAQLSIEVVSLMLELDTVTMVEEDLRLGEDRCH